MPERRSRTIVTLAAAVSVALLTSASFAWGAQDGARELNWDDLIPVGWDPLTVFEAFEDEALQDLSDDSDQAMALLEAYRESARSAPVVAELDGERIRIPGYIVPLDFDHLAISEFLLVPYYGACIHVPPPPANQIVHVTTDEAYPMTEAFRPIWVTGVMTTQAYNHEVGDAGYSIQAMRIEPY